jgi:hypothetical protein
MSVQAEIDTMLSSFRSKAPASISEPISKAQAEFDASFEYSATLQVGDVLPEFSE